MTRALNSLLLNVCFIKFTLIVMLFLSLEKYSYGKAKIQDRLGVDDPVFRNSWKVYEHKACGSLYMSAPVMGQSDPEVFMLKPDHKRALVNDKIVVRDRTDRKIDKKNGLRALSSVLSDRLLEHLRYDFEKDLSEMNKEINLVNPEINSDLMKRLDFGSQKQPYLELSRLLSVFPRLRSSFLIHNKKNFHPLFCFYDQYTKEKKIMANSVRFLSLGLTLCGTISVSFASAGMAIPALAIAGSTGMVASGVLDFARIKKSYSYKKNLRKKIEEFKPYLNELSQLEDLSLSQFNEEQRSKLRLSWVPDLSRLKQLKHKHVYNQIKILLAVFKMFAGPVGIAAGSGALPVWASAVPLGKNLENGMTIHRAAKS